LVSQEKLVSEIRRELNPGVPSRNLDGNDAAVAIVLSPSEGDLRLLLVKRAERDRDPWSGQVAFPGGRFEPEDKTLVETAIRETREETGVDLNDDSSYMGFLGPFKAHTGDIYVTACVFLLKHSVTVKVCVEIFSHQWIPVQELLKESVKSSFVFERNGARMEFPSFSYQHYTIWGLTHRILTTLLDPLALH
jgi:8-oxo-dGTP pyrophosphatase MutT (NUDIX family)